MNIFMLALLVVAASAKPQYNYPKPSGGAISPGGNGKPSKVPGGSPFPGQSGNGGYDYNRPLSGNGKAPIGPSFHNGVGGDGFPGQGQGQVGQQGQVGPNYNQPAIIQKNVYVHIPPPELEEGPEAPPLLPVGAPEKNYKIIFIKAPAPKQSQQPLIPPQPPKEEKTLVYVLVKKPEDASQVVIPTPEPTQPSKPEVFFIRYKPIKEEGAPDGGVPQGVDGQAGGSTGQVGSQGYPSQQTGSQGPSYLPPDNGKQAKGGSY